jgi:hypothetical protein
MKSGRWLNSQFYGQSLAGFRQYLGEKFDSRGRERWHCSFGKSTEDRIEGAQLDSMLRSAFRHHRGDCFMVRPFPIGASGARWPFPHFVPPLKKGLAPPLTTFHNCVRSETKVFVQVSSRMRAESQIAVVSARIRGEFLCRLVGRKSTCVLIAVTGGLPLPGTLAYFSYIPMMLCGR